MKNILKMNEICYCLGGGGNFPPLKALKKTLLIIDMSYPDGESINDGIDPDLCLLTYLQLNKVVHALVTRKCSKNGSGKHILN